MVSGPRKVSRISGEMQLYQQASNPNLRGYGRFQVLGTINRSVAVQIHKLEQLIFEASANLSIRTAVGKYLDALVVDRLPEGRYPGIRAGGYAVFHRFVPSGDDIPVPAKTVLVRPTEDGSDPVLFRTVADVVLEAGDTAVVSQIEAVEAGVRGNVPAFSIVSMLDPVPGIDYVENPMPVSGGDDPETDTSLRRRYIHAILVPGRATKTLIEQHLLALPSVAEVSVHPVGGGDVEIIVDSAEGIFGSPTEISGTIRENLAAGVASRGVLAALVGESVAPLIGDSAGGQIWVRPVEHVMAPESMEVVYADSLGRMRTATIEIPAGTPRGKALRMELEDPADRAVDIREADYEGLYEYELFIGLGEYPYLFNLPETVLVAVHAMIRVEPTAPVGLVSSIEDSVKAYLSQYRIGDQIEYSDIVLNAVGVDFVTGEPFRGVDEVVSCVVSAKHSSIDRLGLKIAIDPDERVRAGSVMVESV